MREKSNFKAFISYSHYDKATGTKIFNALENYKIPKNLVGIKTQTGNIPTRLGYFFRDRDELPAAEDLTVEIKKALKNSEYMIVLCSPHAAASRWVNREILEFKKLNGEKNILTIIIDGEPFATNHNTDQAECFPPALRFKLGKNGKLSKAAAEPIAADLRKGGDGWRRAFLKIVAGLLGINLSNLIVRDLQRKARRVMVITVSSVIGMIVMGLLTYEAITARNEADKSRGEAEDLIEFMLTDLREKLEPVGRLDVLDSVGSKIVSYYDKKDMNGMTDNSMGRQARSYHMLGEINNLQGKKTVASEMFDKAMEATTQLMARDPANADRIFEHAQSVFWDANQKRLAGDFDGAFRGFSLYSSLASILMEKNPNDIKAIREAAYAENNMGVLLLRNMNNPLDAMTAFSNSQKIRLEIIKREGETDSNLIDLANSYAWIADTQVYYEHVKKVIESRQKQLEIYRPLLEKESPNQKAFSQSLSAKRMLAQFELQRGNKDMAIIIAEQNLSISLKLTLNDPDNVLWFERAIRNQLSLINIYSITGRSYDVDLLLNNAEKALKKYYSRETTSFIKRVRLDYMFFLLKTRFYYNDGNFKIARNIANELALALDNDRQNNDISAQSLYIASAIKLITSALLIQENNNEDALVLLNNTIEYIQNSDENILPETEMLLCQFYHLTGQDSLEEATRLSLTNRGYKPYQLIEFPSFIK